MLIIPDEAKSSAGYYNYVAAKIQAGEVPEGTENGVVVTTGHKGADNAPGYDYKIATVEPNTWVTVKMEVTKKMKKADGTDNSYPIKITVNGVDMSTDSTEAGRFQYSGDFDAKISGIPMLAFNDEKEGDGGIVHNSNVQIDNVVAYAVSAPVVTGVNMTLNGGGTKVNIQGASGAANAVLVRARYAEDGSLTKIVQIHPVSINESGRADVNDIEDVQKGDKYILLSGFGKLAPLCEAKIADGASE